MDKFPILSLQNGRLLSNVKMLPGVLRQPGRSNKGEAIEAAESIEILIGMVEKMKLHLDQYRTEHSGTWFKDETDSITALYQELGLE